MAFIYLGCIRRLSDGSEFRVELSELKANRS